MKFETALTQNGLNLRRKPTSILQINVGKLCNQACHHCHVDAGPKRKEIMTDETTSRVLDLLKKSPEINTVDITGGAPELNPNFRKIVVSSRNLGKEVIDRCNLTVLFEPSQDGLGEFLRDHQVIVTASLPCYTKDNVEKQRGSGVFDKSIEALRRLNNLGYGKAGSNLTLNLVYNPGGAFLPGDQMSLENDYKRELSKNFGIEFNHLYTITNMPIQRFLKDLHRKGEYEKYMELLVSSFNPRAAEGIMCRDTISVAWDGQIYDCDFNQMLEIPLGWKKRTLWDIQSFSDLSQDPIAFKDHCFGCTAGAGSSCGGALAESL